MDKEIIDNKIKHEIELFKVYAIFIISIGTGNVSLLFKTDFPDNKVVLFLFIAGVLFFTLFGITFVHSFINIKQLSKKLQSW